MKELNKKTKHTRRTIKEAWATKSAKPTNKTFVMYASVIHVEGFRKIKANSDGTCAVISTNDGEVTISEPGDYFVTRGGAGLTIRPMTADEVAKYTGRLSGSDLRKLDRERKMVHDVPDAADTAAPLYVPPTQYEGVPDDGGATSSAPSESTEPGYE